MCRSQFHMVQGTCSPSLPVSMRGKARVRCGAALSRYPKSRVFFTENFRRELVRLFSFWTTGIYPEFVDTSHWILNLGGGDVLQSSPTGRGICSRHCTGVPVRGRPSNHPKTPSQKTPKTLKTLPKKS